MVKEKGKKDEIIGLLKTLSYKTGFLCKKVVELGQVAEKKPLKSMVVATQDICESFGEKAEVVLGQVTDTVEKSTREIRASFKAGMDSVGEGHLQSSSKKTTLQKKEAVIEVPVAHKKKVVGKKTNAKSPVRKTKSKAQIEKKAPVNLDLEKEIENVTKDVAEV
ncbi:MAG: hypothetical protein HQL12_06200 [Candidatus Omnitrophica bacterium]|nr:hypothetical protein [Candidatus Omnitrophota bacterium]